VIEFEGLDTETILGYSSMIATSKEYRNIKKFDEIIDFLFQDEYKKKIFMLWNQRYDSQALLKFLFIENYDEWYDIGKQIQTFAGYKYKDKYKIVYIPNKMLKISVGNQHVVKMYDIAQFYEWERLDDMSKMYLNTQKQDKAHWIDMSKKFTENEITINELKSYYKLHNDDIGLYCQDDALKTKQLTEYMQKSFLSFGYPFDNPLSSAKLAEEYEIRNYQYPRITDAMNTSHEFVRQSFHGGIFESKIRGFIDTEFHEYDKNSAYPDDLSKLEHLANGKLWRVKEYDDKANMGWYICDFDCKYIPFKKDIPYYYDLILDLFEGKKEIKIPISKTSSFYCMGMRRQIITDIEYKFLIKHGFNVKCHGGLCWYKEKDEYEKPFEWMIEAYKLRRDIKDKDPDDIRQKTLKKMYNSSYGKTAQQKHGYSKMTNFFYASRVTAGCRIEMAEKAIQSEPKIHDAMINHPEKLYDMDYVKKYTNVIEIATDGIYTLNDLNIKDSHELGEYEHVVYHKGLFLGSGMKQLFYDNKKYTTNIRGISNDRSFDLIQLLKDNKRKDNIVVWKTRPIHLNECLMQINKRSLHDLNQFQKVGRRLSVNTDKKHHWTKTYKNFKDLLKHQSYAIPFTVNEVNGIYKDFIEGE
jgi:hypothetical protein